MPSDDAPPVATSDELFGLPVGEFITARDGLVRRLKADGAKEDADAVKALRRPTLAAWAVNQVVRADPEAGERLATAAHDIERAQRRALSGVRDASLREASAARRHLVEELVDRAAAVLVAAGAAPASHLDDVGRTFEAAATNPEVAGRVAEGCLSAPIHPQADFTAVAGLTAVVPAPPPDAGDADDDSDGRAGEGDADPELVAKRRAAIRALETATTRAEASADRARAARQEATTSAERAGAARRAADDAQRIARNAKRTAERAAREAQDLEARAGKATSAAARAEARAQADADEAEHARSVLDDLE